MLVNTSTARLDAALMLCARRRPLQSQPNASHFTTRCTCQAFVLASMAGHANMDIKTIWHGLKAASECIFVNIPQAAKMLRSTFTYLTCSNAVLEGSNAVLEGAMDACMQGSTICITFKHQASSSDAQVGLPTDKLQACACQMAAWQAILPEWCTKPRVAFLDQTTLICRHSACRSWAAKRSRKACTAVLLFRS